VKTPANRASVYHVQHQWDGTVEALDELWARAFGDRWGEGAEAWRQKIHSRVATYDLLYSGTAGDVERKLREAGAEGLEIKTYRTSPGK
jgi:hypothetical protein